MTAGFCKAGEVDVTGGRFRSYVLWGVIHNRPQVRPVKVEV